MPFLSTRHRRVRTVLSAAVVLATLVACSATVDGTASRAMGTTTGGATTTDGRDRHHPAQPDRRFQRRARPRSRERRAVPAGLETFYGQQLSWGPCAGLLDRRLHQGAVREVDVPVCVPDGAAGLQQADRVDHQARGAEGVGQHRGSDRVGGDQPGRARRIRACASAAGTAGSAKALLQRFDLVGFDPRGVGCVACRPSVVIPTRSGTPTAPWSIEPERRPRSPRRTPDTSSWRNGASSSPARTTSTARRSSARSAPSTWPRTSMCCGPFSETAS